MVSADSVTPDELLVQATLEGDQQAFTELTQRYKKRIFGLASRFTQDSHDLDDLCQEIFVQVYFKLNQFRAESPFEHWILRIATFKCYDYVRKRKREGPRISVDSLVESGYEPEARSTPPSHPDLERLYAALAKLSPKERLVITLLELEENSVQEISQRTGWSVANVKVRAFRARAALRELLTQSSP